MLTATTGFAAMQMGGPDNDICRSGACASMANRFGKCGEGVRRAASLWFAPLGLGLSRALRGVLAPAGQCVLGRHLCGGRLPATPWRVAAQGLVPHDRYCGGRGGNRDA